MDVGSRNLFVKFEGKTLEDEMCYSAKELCSRKKAARA
jgi:hypothetical protein